MQTEPMTDEQLKVFTRRIVEAVETRYKIVPLNSLHRAGYSLKRPIYITIEHDDDSVIASLDEIEAFAYADNEFEAIDGLREEIATLYEDLRSDTESLGPLPRKWLAFLDELIDCHENR